MPQELRSTVEPLLMAVMSGVRGESKRASNRVTRVPLGGQRHPLRPRLNGLTGDVPSSSLPSPSFHPRH